jgi:hypothetical protein
MQLKESWKDWPRKLRARTAERSCAPAALAIARKSSAIFDEAPGWSAASTCLTLFRFGKRLGNGNSKNVAALRWGRNARKALGFPPAESEPVINLKTATAFRATVPDRLLALADGAVE